MSDDLEKLGPTGFQDLAASLAVASFGPGVQVMGSGRDGGRDLYHRGPLIWKPTEDQPAEVWEGYTVLQVKHRATRSASHKENAVWLWGHVRDELDDWANPYGDRNPVPDFLIIITNVMLTPFPQVGGHDFLNENVKRYLERLADNSREVDSEAIKERIARLARLKRIKKVRIWDGNQIQAMLRVHPGVRNAFPGFLTAGDVFAALAQLTDSVPPKDLEEGLREHAKTTLMGEGFIYFDEAGSGDGQGIPVHEVAIDLPITFAAGARRASVVQYVLDRAEHVLAPGVTTQEAPRHLIVTGAPGNGKTTISKFLVQVFRAALLEQADDLSDGHRDVIRGTAAALKRFGRELPKNRRWPMRVDLALYAQEGGLSDDSTLLRWIAHKVSRRSDMGEVKPWALKTWMQKWPWLLVLDGLDEVTEPAVRKRLIERVTEFVNTAEADNCDVLVVLTTRPVGYTENIAPAHFERIDLDFLELPEAVRYGKLATKVRLRTDLDRIERVLTRLYKAAEDEALQHLLRTPLQVLILTIIIDGAGQLAPDRYSLFRGYYDAVFRRERDKPGGLHRMLQEFGQQIQQLHERVGFELQVRAETGDRSYASLTAAELRQIAWQVLDEAGFKPSGKDAPLLDKIFDAATKRLVLIAPRGTEGYGFDVRSLQELMAAMHLTTGLLDDVLQRLRSSAASPYWRNTWLFAAGQLFSTPQPHQHDALVRLVETIDDQDADYRLGQAVPIGPRLALDIIDDGMARSYPRWRDRLVAHGLKVLTEPNPPDLSPITKCLVRFASTGDDQRAAVAEGLRASLVGTSTTRETAAALQQLVPAIVEEIRAHSSVRGLAGVRRHPDAVLQPDPARGWEDFEVEILTNPCTGEEADLLHAAAAALRHIAANGGRPEDAAVIQRALEVEPVAAGLAAALVHVIGHERLLVENLRDGVVPAVHRRLIGEQLRSMSVGGA
ncbi:NACHT domain-containing protein [Micromonospora sp. NPDC000663]|uniref:NACHT domain-containing protein n=1 Tax=Micromonospora sp. NPDC000663 TaxID=3364218 RepID=UPI0036AF1AEE